MTDEHHVVHTLYRLEKDGYATFKCKNNLHRPGKNLTTIRLTESGLRKYRELIK